MPFETDFIGGLLMKEPKVPKFRKISAQEEQQKAVAGNIEAMPEIKTLGADVNRFMAEQAAASMETLMPGMGAVRSKVTDELLSGLSGELPKDVQDLIARKAAERGISAGTAGSQFAQFGELGTLGITSLQRIQQSMDSAMRWNQAVQSSLPMFDATRFMVSPELQLQHAVMERDKQFNVSWAKNQIAAQYAPGTIAGQAMMKAGDEFVQLLNTAVGSMGGAAGGAIASDVNLKENIKPVVGVLDALEKVPVSRWNYKSDPELTHIGPMAQDFNPALGVGSDEEKLIYYMDLAGTALAAVKELSGKVNALAEQVEQLKN